MDAEAVVTEVRTLTPVHSVAATSSEVVVVLAVSHDGSDLELVGRLAARGAREALRASGVASVAHSEFEVRARDDGAR